MTMKVSNDGVFLFCFCSIMVCAAAGREKLETQMQGQVGVEQHMSSEALDILQDNTANMQEIQTEAGVEAQQSSDEIIQRPAAGLALTLGSLYDMRSNTAVTGFLWPKEIIDQHKVTIDTRSTTIKYKAIESRADKAELLDVSAELSLEYATQLKIWGSARFMMDKAENSYVAEVAMNHETQTVAEEISFLSHVLKNNLIIDAIDSKLATHVVTKVKYGANSIVRFSKEVTDIRDKKLVQGALDIEMTGGITTIRGKASLDYQRAQETSTQGLEVRIFADIVPEGTPIPSTMAEAKTYVEQIPAIIGKGVPLHLTFFPLSKLNTAAARLKGKLSEAAILRTNAIFDELESSSQKIGDLLRLDWQGFNAWKWKVDAFRIALQKYTDEYMQKVGETLDVVRSGGADSNLLLSRCSSHEGSIFNRATIIKNVTDLDDQIRTLQSLLKSLRDANVKIAYSFADFSSLVVDGTHKRVWVLVVKGLHPFSDPGTNGKARAFAQYASNRKESSMDKFVFVHYDSFEEAFDTNLMQTTVWRYENGVRTSEDFTLPGIPGKPPKSPYMPSYPTEDSSDFRPPWISASYMGGNNESSWLKLSWQKPDYPPDCTESIACGNRILRYIVYWQYWQRHGQDWTLQSNKDSLFETVSARTQNVRIFGLQAGHSYRFKVAATNVEGTGPWSELSAPIDLLYAIAKVTASPVSDSASSTTWAWNKWGPADVNLLKNSHLLTATVHVSPPITGYIGTVKFEDEECKSIQVVHPQKTVTCALPEQPFALFEDELQKAVEVKVFDDENRLVAKGSWIYKSVLGQQDADGLCRGRDTLVYTAQAAEVCPDDYVMKRCSRIAHDNGVIPFKTWGSISETDKQWWKTNNCDENIEQACKFQTVVIGNTTACGLTSAGDLQCWGETDFGYPFATYERDTYILYAQPTGKFKALSGSQSKQMGNCFVALRENGRIVIFGMCGISHNFLGCSTSQLAGPYTAMHSDARTICAIKEDGSLMCCGYIDRKWMKDNGSPTPQGSFTSVALSGEFFSAVEQATGNLQTWGYNTYSGSGGQAMGPTMQNDGKTHKFRKIVFGGTHNALGLTQQGTLICWKSGYISGSDTSDQGHLVRDCPSGEFKDIASGSGGWFKACAVTQAGEIKCWGRDAIEAPGRNTNQSFAKVFVGQKYDCASHTDGKLVCWGQEAVAPPTICGV